MCHVSTVTCPMSPVICHCSENNYPFFCNEDPKAAQVYYRGPFIKYKKILIKPFPYGPQDLVYC